MSEPVPLPLHGTASATHSWRALAPLLAAGTATLIEGFAAELGVTV